VTQITSFDHLIAKPVRNNGDVCNAPRTGIITCLRTDRWGTHAVILWDDDEAVGWERDGTPALINEAVSAIAAHTIAPAGTPFARFSLIAA
jgi:hypothetical protein